ncbi:MAG: protease [Acidobacteria bacterium]|nr:MAG: protease [Acidobacteriota bacterium]
MQTSLKGKRVAILATDGFEQSELAEPLKALEEAGATAHIVSPKAGAIKGWKHTEWGDSFAVDATLDQADPQHYDALVLPGGVMNPDKLRRDPKVQQFVRSFFEEGKPVGAICHGPWTLIDTGVVKGRKVTSYETIQTDLKNAGASWVDQEVVVDNGLIEEIAEGRHAGRAMAGASTGTK